MNRTDLADPTAGILASLEAHQPLAVFERGGSGGTAGFELEAEPLAGRLELDGEGVLGHWSVQAQRLRGRLRGGDGSTTPLEAIGAVCQGGLNGSSPDAPGRDPAALRRNIVICLEDGSLLALVSAREGRDGEHGDETFAAALATASGEVTEFVEVLLSTEYGPDRRQRRATIELWPAPKAEAAQSRGHNGPLRGAGSLVAATELRLPGADSSLAFFEWSIGGSPAIGRYEIIRAH